VGKDKLEDYVQTGLEGHIKYFYRPHTTVTSYIDLSSWTPGCCGKRQVGRIRTNRSWRVHQVLLLTKCHSHKLHRLVIVDTRMLWEKTSWKTMYKHVLKGMSNTFIDHIPQSQAT